MTTKHVLRTLSVCAVLLFLSVFAGAQNQPVTAKYDNAKIKTVIHDIEVQTGLSFVMDENNLEMDKDVTLTFDETPVADALRQLFGEDVSIVFKNTFVIIKAEPKTPEEKEEAQAEEAVADDTPAIRRVSGVVVDETDEPVIGAAVIVQGTNVGITTATDGSFSLNNVSSDDVLLVTALSYKDKSVTVGKQDNIKIVLYSDNMLLEEVVVVGFGTQKKVNLTGSVATVDSKNLSQRPVASATQALQGLDPSLLITQGSGSPESSQSISIRGTVSINSGSPLILVDGVEMELRYVNPNDIESISILKDASASAIYGAKASAGVILVTTRSGSKDEGKAKVNFSTGISIISPTTSTDFITTGYDHVKLNNEFFDRFPNGNRMVYNEEQMQMLYERRNDKTENPDRPWVITGSDGYYYYYGNFDWYHYLFNTHRLQQDHNLSVSGGTDKVKYYVAGRYYDQEGMFSQRFGSNHYSTYSFRGNVSAKLTKKLTYTANLAFAENVMTYPGYSSYEKSIWDLSANLSPVFVPYNPNGSVVERVHQFSASNNICLHTMGQLANHSGYNRKDTSKYTLKNALSYDIIPGLKATVSYALNYQNTDNEYRMKNYWCGEGPEVNTYIENLSGNIADYYQENHYAVLEQTFEAFANYNKTFAKDHNFSATAGMQYYDYYINHSNLKATNLTEFERDPLVTDGNQTDGYSIAHSLGRLKTLGVFARVNYDYKGRYLAELSARADGSSRFAPGHRWAFFPSFSAGWRISDEPFFAPAKNVVSNMKLRYSIGSLGNQQMSSYYPYIEAVSAGSKISYSEDGKTQLTTASVSDPVSSGLTWETVTTNNLGIDLEFLDGRLSFTAEGYIRDTKNMLTTSITLPSVYGASTPKENCADLRTKGYELYLTWKDRFNLAGKDFNYSITGTFGDYKAVITKYNNPDKTLTDHYVGRVLGEVWGYHVDGLFSSDEEAIEYMANVNSSAVQGNVFNSINADENILRAGDLKYADLDGNGVISTGSNTVDDPGDRRIIGNSRPRFLYTGRFDFSWFGFDLSVYLQGIGRINWYASNGDHSMLFWGPYALCPTAYIHKDFEKLCWSEDNTDAYFPRRRNKQALGGSALGVINDRYLQNAGYIRLKNINFGYTVPLKSKVIDKLRFGISGENLAYWSPMKKHCKIIDPELAVATGTNYSGSGTGYTYPRTYTFNVQLTF